MSVGPNSSYSAAWEPGSRFRMVDGAPVEEGHPAAHGLVALEMRLTGI